MTPVCLIENRRNAPAKLHWIGFLDLVDFRGSLLIAIDSEQQTHVTKVYVQDNLGLDVSLGYINNNNITCESTVSSRVGVSACRSETLPRVKPHFRHLLPVISCTQKEYEAKAKSINPKP